MFDTSALFQERTEEELKNTADHYLGGELQWLLRRELQELESLEYK